MRVDVDSEVLVYCQNPYTCLLVKEEGQLVDFHSIFRDSQSSFRWQSFDQELGLVCQKANCEMMVPGMIQCEKVQRDWTPGISVSLVSLVRETLCVNQPSSRVMEQKGSILCQPTSNRAEKFFHLKSTTYIRKVTYFFSILSRRPAMVCIILRGAFLITSSVRIIRTHKVLERKVSAELGVEI